MIYRVLLMVLDKYGLAIAQLGLICWLAWRFHNNHLKHINDGLEDNGKKIDNLITKVGDLSERVAKIEGHLGKT